MTRFPSQTGLEVAVIGLACRFPGAADARAFWSALEAGTDLVTRFSIDELRACGVPDALLADPSYVRAQGVLAEHDRFDPALFGLNPAEAELMDPQQRILLECGWSALEDAGWLPDEDVRCGVYAGAYYNTYRDIALRAGRLERATDAFVANLLNEKDFLATHLAYRLDLVGPAVTVQSACSTSLVAVHLACQALLAGECDLALAGGATARPVQATGYLYQDGGIFSPDGRTRAFDAAAAGTVPGNGVGLVVLKRLADALADRDHVRAVIRGSAAGNDGARRIGFTAPSAAGQARIVAAALAAAQVDPRSVGYVEAHGSGTALGDPIEVEALSRVYRTAGSDRNWCGIGSVKTNIGHAHAAAGIAGLIKAVLSLEARHLAPSLHFSRANARIDFAASPFRVVAEGRHWAEGAEPRRAAVSSFGMGGTGAHVILEEAPGRVPPRPDGRDALLLVSAATADALQAGARRLADALAAADAPALADAAWTLHRGRRPLASRMAAVAADGEAAARALRGQDPASLVVGGAAAPARSVAFLFPGLGDHRPGMAGDLHRTEPVFAEALDHCCAVLARECGEDLRDCLLAAPPARGLDLRRMAGRAGPVPGLGPLADTARAQPAVFAVDYALAMLWRSWGVRPDGMIGYSLGEYVAACLAGVMALDDALRLVAGRARLIARLPPGAMLALPLGEARLRDILPDELSLAAVNGPALCVVAGADDAVDAFAARLSGEGVLSRRIETSHAFHSRMLAPAGPALAALLEGLPLRPPAIPYLSNVTGDWIRDEEATDPAYWVRHMCEPVRFADGIARLQDDPSRILLEVGPGQSTASLASQLRPARTRDGAAPVVSSLPSAYDARPARAHLLRAAGRLWTAGVDLAAQALHGEEPRRVPLPTYPFARTRYWLAAPAAEPPPRDPQVRRADVGEWFAAAGWETCPASAPPVLPADDGLWLVLADGSGVGSALAERLRAGGRSVEIVGHAIEDDETRPDIADLLARLVRESRPPRRIVLTGCLDGDPVPRVSSEAFEAAQARGFYPLLALARALAVVPPAHPVEVVVATPGAWSVLPGAAAQPDYATVLGPVRTFPFEQPTIRGRVVDLEPMAIGCAADALLRELAIPDRPDLVAIRGGRAWRPVHQPLRLPAAGGDATDGVYLVTGGLGGIGLALAGHLAGRGAAALVLVGRSAVDEGSSGDPRAAALHRARALGAEVRMEVVDVTDREALGRVVEATVTRYGRLDGVFHAAGVEGAGLMQLKDPAEAGRVLGPKCRGALALLEAVAPHAPGFVVLFSSSLALTGAPGQSDYAAANAYLDALAQARDGTGPTRVMSINWDAWRDIGMAHRNLAAPARDPVEHPLLRRVTVERDGRRLYEAEIRSGHWLVDEHRMAGHAVVAGTGHIELVRAAVTHALTGRCGGRIAVELSDLVFFSPVVVAQGEARLVRVQLTPRGVGSGEPPTFDVQLSSRPADAPAEDWRLNAAARAGGLAEGPGPAVPAERVIAEGELADLGRPIHRGPMSFGPRSRCLEQVHGAGRQALARVRLPEAFAGDLEGLPLHPAVMDICAAFVGLHLASRFRIPISYGRLRYFGPLAGAVHSHHRLREPDDGGETVTADFVIRDMAGRPLVEVDGFVLKRLDDVDAHMRALLDGSSTEIVRLADRDAHPGRPDRLALADHLAQGIRASEGLDALDRILAWRGAPGVAVTTRPLADLAQDLRRSAPAGSGSPDRGGAVHARPVHSRPDLAAPFAAPRTPTETVLAALWCELLSLERVGVHDGFFELGGHSLLGLSLGARLRETFGIDIPLGTLFQALTVETLARTIETLREAA